jgi:uncharacterized tellurite resistance protein B-like protein
MKAEIEKILGELVMSIQGGDLTIYSKEMIADTSSSFTALIIKWLESKRVKIIEDCWEIVERDKTRNQLITELIGEVR